MRCGGRWYGYQKDSGEERIDEPHVKGGVVFAAQARLEIILAELVDVDWAGQFGLAGWALSD